ncbi:DEAD/DEAH box helicase family protein [Candidatus Woesearchaeota archaeon]|nr:DEAD/DEAH box helicase family protein [Candidatus Woesearchaeota archaeon]
MVFTFKPRLYQEKILDTAALFNTLVVLPTGLGKTAISIMLVKHRLEIYPESKAIIFAPTKPLVEQHKKTFDKEGFGSVVFTGTLSSQKRQMLFKENNLIFSTPQGFENDVLSKKISLKDVSLVVFDEAHRATGSYAYVFLAEEYVRQSVHGRILALTASPGSKKEDIEGVCKNLHIERIEVRTDEDSDVKQYINETTVNWLEVELPDELKRIRKLLDDTFKSKISELNALGVDIERNGLNFGKKGLLELQRSLQQQLVRGHKDFQMLRALSMVAQAIKVQHALELIETQGVHALNEYLTKIFRQAEATSVKAVKALASDPSFKATKHHCDVLMSKKFFHPKIGALEKLLKEEISRKTYAKIIIFTQFRDQADEIVSLCENIGISNSLFIGQTKKKGKSMSQKAQQEILERFRNNEFNCLIATSVAEEGLDIPSVDVVVFYEAIPSAIRTVQRRGRTGRQDAGKVFVLIAKGTRDESYKWSSHHKEKRMISLLKSFQSKQVFNDLNVTGHAGSGKSCVSDKGQKTLEGFKPENHRFSIKIDFREKSAGAARFLQQHEELKIEPSHLEVGDYLISDECCVELKTAKDFVDSLLDKRLFSQLTMLKKYPKPIIVIEGRGDVFSQRNVHPNAIRGLLASIALDYRIPIIFSKDSQETAEFLMLLVKREQDTGGKSMHPRLVKPQGMFDQQLKTVSSFPFVGALTAEKLLDEFRSIRKIINADVAELQKVGLIGEKTAKSLYDFFRKER